MAAQDCKKEEYISRAPLPISWRSLINIRAWLPWLWPFGRARKLPVLLSREPADSPLHCLLMVAAYHDGKLDLKAVRRRLGPSARNLRLAEMVQVAGTLGLRGRPLRIELTDLHRLPMPAILQWHHGGCVVVKRCKAEQLWLHDPQSGACVLDVAVAAQHFTGVAVILEREPSAEARLQVLL